YVSRCKASEVHSHHCAGVRRPGACKFPCRSSAECWLQGPHLMSQDKLAIACKNETFDLLLVGHLLEHVEREQMCVAFRTYNPGVPILQLQAVQAVPCTADYEFDVENGPEALVQFLEKILAGWERVAKVGD